MNPSAGFALWDDRIIFTGLGFEGSPPSFDQPAQALTLFSTGLDGRGLTILKRETLSVSARPGRTLFRIRLLRSRAWWRHSRRPGSAGEAHSSWPWGRFFAGDRSRTRRPGHSTGVLAREDLQAETLATTPHVTGLFTLNDWIGLVFERPSPAGPHLSVAWLSSHLDLVKEEGIELPDKVTKWDVVVRVIQAPPDGVLFLVIPHGAGRHAERSPLQEPSHMVIKRAFIVLSFIVALGAAFPRGPRGRTGNLAVRPLIRGDPPAKIERALNRPAFCSGHGPLAGRAAHRAG